MNAIFLDLWFHLQVVSVLLSNELLLKGSKPHEI
jgi:hypothetical protein